MPIGRGMKLRPGMTLAIEPMINMGTWEVWVLEDDWTVVTQDSLNSAHYDNPILITEGEPELLSYPEWDHNYEPLKAKEWRKYVKGRCNRN